MPKAKKKNQLKKNPLKQKKVLNVKKETKITKKSVTRIVSKKVISKTKPKIKSRVVKKLVKKIGLPRIPLAPRVDTKTEFPAESLFKARIKVIGIGGGGGSIVSEIGRSLEKANFVIADTDIRALKKRSGIKYIWFGEEQTHGLGTGVNVELARTAAEGAKEKISSNFKDQDIIIFIASLGGGLGSGATQVFADAAREFGGITFGIFTMPFKFEGKNKLRIAQTALKSLRESLNVSLVIPNEKIFKVIDANTPITNAFSMVNKSLIESLESLIDLIYTQGVINIDFADLRTILRGIGNSAFLNTVEESGKDRAEKICERIMVNPLLQNNGFKPEKIMFNVAGSENLSMFEVEKISSHISAQNPEAKIIFGISKSPKLKNKIKTTILITGGGTAEKVVKKEEPVVLEKPVIITEIKKEEPAKIKEKIKKAKKQVNKVKTPKKIKKPAKKQKEVKQKEESPISIIPAFEPRVVLPPVLEQTKLSVVESSRDLDRSLDVSRHGTIRRSGLEIKKAEELEEKKRIAQEKEWEIPAFLRRVKYKN